MNKFTALSLAALLSLSAASAALAADPVDPVPAAPAQGAGPECDCPHQQMHSQQMHSQHMQHGKRMQRDKPVTAAQVHDILAGRIAWHGEDLKVGKITDKDANTFVAEILSPKGEVARKVEVDKKTGHFDHGAW